MRLVVLFALLSASCVCWDATKAQTPQCVVLHEIVDCTEGAAKSMLPGLIPLFADLLSNQQSIDTNAILQRLEGMGFKDAGCILASLEAAFIGRVQASPEMAHKTESVHSLLATWKQKHDVATVKFKVIGPNGEPTLR